MADTVSPDDRKKCPYGFTCSTMSSRQIRSAKECEYLKECRSYKSRPYGDLRQKLKHLDENISKLCHEIEHCEENKRSKYKLRRRLELLHQIKSHELSIVHLRSFANHQAIKECTGDLYAYLYKIRESKGRLTQQLNNRDGRSNLNRDYIAPEGVEAHVYSVKRPAASQFPEGTPIQEIRKRQKVYRYWKLQSKTPQFKSKGGDDKSCKTIHLGKGDNPKTIQARLGIERRNRLSKIRTKLMEAAAAVEEAALLAEEVLCFEDFEEE